MIEVNVHRQPDLQAMSDPCHLDVSRSFHIPVMVGQPLRGRQRSQISGNAANR